jgi:hypothetical protein
MKERLLVDVLNGTRTDIVREVRNADAILHILISGLEQDETVPAIVRSVQLDLLRQAHTHLARVTD